MLREDVYRLFDQIRIWKKGDERAPHKPLLILYALGQLSRGGSNCFAFCNVAPALTSLLEEFGPARKSYHPEFPFWYLQNDSLWIIDEVDRLKRRTGKNSVTKGELIKHDAHGYFPSEIAEQLQGDPSLIADIALRLLEGHFPSSLHQDILDAVGLDLEFSALVTKRKRDPEFRRRILTAYEYACAVCGFDVRLGSQFVALEAAHIKWHQAGGPDEESNGLALCSLHHKAFDRGAFTIQSDWTLVVSELAYGQRGFEEWLLQYHGLPIRPPHRDSYIPNTKFLAWHQSEVFKSPPRDLLGCT